MALYSSSIKNGTGKFYLELKEVSQDIGNNSSVVSYSLYIKGVDGFGFWNRYGTGYTEIYIDGARVHYETGRNFDISNGGRQDLASGRTTIKHKEDGSKSFDFSAKLWSSLATGDLKGSFTLSKIPRASDFHFENLASIRIDESSIGSTISIVIDSKVSSFSHSLRYEVEGSGETLLNKSMSRSISWTSPTSFLSRYMNDKNRLDVDFYLDTYDGNKKIGTVKRVLSLVTSDEQAPTITSVSFSDVNSKKNGILGYYEYYQLLTDLNVRVYASAKAGASILKYRVKLGDSIKEGNDVTFYSPNLSGTQSVEVEVVDSRGKARTRTEYINFKPYKVPNIAFFDAYRASSNKRFGEARLRLESTVIRNMNPLDVKVDIKEKGGGYWRNVYSATVGNGSFDSTISLGELEEFKAYEVRATISDKFNSHTALSSVPYSKPSLVIGANNSAVGIGKIPIGDKGLEVDGPLTVKEPSLTTLTLDGGATYGPSIHFRHKGMLNSIVRVSDDGFSIYSNNNKIILLGEVYIKNSIKPQFEVTPYEISLTGLSGYLRCTKDPVGTVHLWGSVHIETSHANTRWKNWGKVPDGWQPRLMMAVPMTNGSKVVNGLVLTNGRNLTWVGCEGNSYTPPIGQNLMVDFVYKAKSADW